MKRLTTSTLLCLVVLATPAAAQEPVVGVPNPERLFTDTDPQRHANKQVALRIMRELLECNQWNRAQEWLTDRYLQHNPNVPSGRDSAVTFFQGLVDKGVRKRDDTCAQLTTPIVAVLADGDLVTVVWPMTCQHDGGQPYTSTWFDMWRIVGGRADEHWDPAMRIQTGCQPGR